MTAIWKLVISLWFMVIGLFVTVGIVFAQSPLLTTSYQLPTTVSPISPLYTDLLVSNLFHTFSCLAIGQSVIGQPCLTYQITKNAQGAIQGVPYLSSANLSGGLLGTTTGLIAGLYANPPVRTADYLASVGQDLGIVKKAHAQGVVGSGNEVLKPVIALWTVSRNICYIFMIIIFLIIGLMVMFRQRINPQTVITAQAALPGLVIGLILITFSYFIAALISDVAFIGTNVVGYYFSIAQQHDIAKDGPLADKIKGKNVIGIFTPFTQAANSGRITSFVESIWDDLSTPGPLIDPLKMDPQKAITLLTGFILFQLTGPIGSLYPGLGQVSAGALSIIGAVIKASGVAGMVLSFIAIIILIYAMFRLLLRLINAWLTIIFLTFTAPFQFLFAALPGRQGIATSWILNMLANILAFPAVLAVLYFVAFLLGPTFIRNNCDKPQNSNNCVFNITQRNELPDGSFASSVYAQDHKVIGNQAFPLFGGLNLDFIEMLLAFGALVALPSIPDIIARSVGRLGAAGQLIGQEIGSSVGAGRGYAGQFQQGIGGLAGQVGRLTSEPGYVWDPAANEGAGGYTLNPLAYRAGQVGRIRAGFSRPGNLIDKLRESFR